MKKVLISLALLALPSMAMAQVYCEPINHPQGWDGTNNLSISWDQCWFPGSTATSLKSFNCNPTPTTNVSNILHFQFKVAHSMTSSSAETGVVDVITAQPSLPQFYHYEGTGCAGSGAGVNKGFGIAFIPAGTSGCVITDGFFDPYCDLGDGTNDCALSGSSYVADAPNPGWGRFLVAAVRANARPLDPGFNYWAWQISFSNRMRNACAGCGVGADVIFQSFGLESSIGEPDQCLTGPDTDKGPDRSQHNGGGTSGPTPVQNTTWGQIKALYR